MIPSTAINQVHPRNLLSIIVSKPFLRTPCFGYLLLLAILLALDWVYCLSLCASISSSLLAIAFLGTSGFGRLLLLYRGYHREILPPIYQPASPPVFIPLLLPDVTSACSCVPFCHTRYAFSEVSAFRLPPLHKGGSRKVDHK